MVLSKCAACAIELGTGGKECGGCQTRYCGPECQKQHWEEGGHDQLCKSIKRAGGAEQFYANTKYTEAVAVAAEACADDTKGQTCYICYGEGDEDEGLVRRCSCRGENGFVHLSCLVRAAQVAVERGGGPGWERWDTCGLCEQEYYGDVLCALGWACWKTYMGRPETDLARRFAMTRLGHGLLETRHHEDAVSVMEAQLSLERRLGAPERLMLVVRSNLASSYEALGRNEEAMNLQQDVYSGCLRLNGEEHYDTLLAANNYAVSLACHDRFEEAKSLYRKSIPVAQRVLGESNEITLKMRKSYATVLYRDPTATLFDLRKAVTMLEELAPTALRVLGGAHPIATELQLCLQNARAALRAREEQCGNQP